MKSKMLGILSLVLAVLMLSAFTGCGDSKTQSDNSSSVLVSDNDIDMDDVDMNGIGSADANPTGSGSASANRTDSGSAGTHQTGSGSAGVNQNSGSGGGTASKSGITKVENDDIFKNIPKELRGTTVTIAHWGDEGASEYVKVQKAFTKQTGIRVKWVQLSEGDYISKIVNQISAAQGPDIVICNSTFPVALEAVQQLPSYFNINDGFWDKRVSEALSANGKYYFVNSYSSPFTGGTVVYYNKKIFSDNGLTNPDDYLKAGKWTYENLTKCMQDVYKIGKHGGMTEAMVLAQQMGASMIKYNNKTGTFSGDATNSDLTAAIQWNAECVRQGITGNQGISAFASGQMGICMAGTYGMKYNGYFKDMSPSEIGVVPLPVSYQGKALKYMPLGTRGYGIAKGAKNPQGAYYFLRYFLDYEKYGDAGAQIFANKVMEKYFVQTQLVNFRKADLYFEYYKDILPLIGKGWNTEDWAAIRHSAPGQVAVELGKMTNVCTNAANEANAKLKAFIK